MRSSLERKENDEAVEVGAEVDRTELAAGGDKLLPTDVDALGDG